MVAAMRLGLARGGEGDHPADIETRDDDVAASGGLGCGEHEIGQDRLVT
jgi:hypothetical protein